ncbi:MAG: DEAD/DEAH box helicase [Chitinophagaceae bacterium]
MAKAIAQKKLKSKRSKNNIVQPLISHIKKPLNLTGHEWQSALRKQFAGSKIFHIEKTGTEPVYSDYKVNNPETGNTYKVAIRSADNSFNFCTCLDFKNNKLGTCKHIEAVLQFINSRQKLKKQLASPNIPAYTSIYLCYREERAVKIRIGSDDHNRFTALSKKYFDKNNCLLAKSFLHIEKLLVEFKKINPSFRFYEDALEFILSYREKTSRQQVITTENKKLLENVIKTPLFSYQEEGILFAAKAGRSILADEMGLGKTIQAIGFAEMMQRRFGLSKILIICPTSLKYQWKSEIEKFTGSKVAVIEGNLLQRMKAYSEYEHFYKIISYNVVLNDWAHINEMRPDLIILDEAQRIKNWKTKVSQSIKKLKSDYALVLTGTPLENNLEELYSLMQFIDPFVLGSLYHFLTVHQIKEEGTDKIIGYQRLHEIRERLSDVLLRRTKKQVLKQLPERIDKNLFVPLTAQQEQMHTEYAGQVSKLVNKWKRFGYLNEQDRQRLLIFLNLMRMVCDSTYIVDQETNYQTKLDELENILDEIMEMQDEKVVIFSQWERMTRLVVKILDKKGIGYENLHGGVPSIKREALFKNFQYDQHCRVFLSTDAGGVGLNLQSAAWIINLDIPWNPAVLEQRIGRIHRMGQKKNICVINLVAKDSIEERMLGVLKFKSALAAGILDNGENSIFMGEEKFKKFMRSVEEVTQSLPASSIEDKGVKEEEPSIQKDPEALNTSVSEIPVAESWDDEVIAEPAGPVNVEEKDAAASLLQSGSEFLIKLAATLIDKKNTQDLVTSLIQKDVSTGKIYLKIPVENEAVITKTVEALAGIFKALIKS